MKRDVWIVAVVALSLRLLTFLQFSATPFASNLFMDSRIYDAWAKAISEGDLLGGTRPFFTEPGYAYFLAILKVMHGGTAAARLVQVLLGSGTAVLTLLIGRRIGGRAVGLAAGIIVACYLPSIYYEGLVLKTTLEVFLSTAWLLSMLVLLERQRRSAAFVAGLLAGASILVRSNLLAAVMLAAVLTFLVLRQAKSSRALALSGLVLVGPVLALSATVLRNEAVSSSPLPLPYNSGINFYIGNCAACNGADPGYPFGRGLPEFEEEDSRIEAERRAGRHLTEQESSTYWWRESFHEIKSSPGRWLGLIWSKFRMFWNHYEITDNVSIYFVEQYVPLLRWPLPGFWLAGPIGFAGLAAGLWARNLRGQDSDQTLLRLFILTQLGVVVLFHVADRYRLVCIPAMLVTGLTSLKGLRAAGPGPRARVLAPLCAGIVLAFFPTATSSRGQDLSNHYAMLAEVAGTQQRGEDAVEALRRGVLQSPESPDAHFNLAVVLFSMPGGQVEAEREVREAIRLKTGFGEAYLLLGRILDSLERPLEAAQAALMAAESGYKPVESLSSAAAMYGKARQYEDAQRVVAEALKLRPEDAHSLDVLCRILWAKGDIPGAISAGERSLRSQPDNASLVKLLQRLRSNPN